MSQLVAYVTERPACLSVRSWYATCPGFGARRFGTLGAAWAALGRWHAARCARFPDARLRVEVRPRSHAGAMQYKSLRHAVRKLCEAATQEAQEGASWRLS